MFKFLVRSIGMVPAIIVGALYLSVAHATVFDSNIEITGNTSFDEIYSLGGSGDFNMVSGSGANDASSSYSASTTVTGDNPLADFLTDIGDGFGFTGSASVEDDDFTIGFDTSITATNKGAADIFEVIFKLVFSNNVNADGDDAYSDSELTLWDDNGEIFFSDLISDTLNGDSVGGNSIATFGDALSEIDDGNLLFSYMLNPGDSITMDMYWTLEGGDYFTGLAEANLSAFLSVNSVVNQSSEPEPNPVPAPATILLFGLGMLFFSIQHRTQG